MADEVNLAFVMAGEPAANIAAWRADPPLFLAVDTYRLKDDSYESLVYEAERHHGLREAGDVRHSARPLYRLTFTFRPDDGATQVTVLGQSPSDTARRVRRVGSPQRPASVTRWSEVAEDLLASSPRTPRR